MTFTTQPPTRAGAYWFKYTDKDKPKLVELFIVGKQLVVWTGSSNLPLSDYRGDYDGHACQWSERLIPVSEVEKAWREGYNWTNYTPVGSEVAWSDSHARKVVEGEV
jgi:hypothetical protein